MAVLVVTLASALLLGLLPMVEAAVEVVLFQHWQLVEVVALD
jgi:hypothetical protein